jgi:cardiolipin synthase
MVVPGWAEHFLTGYTFFDWVRFAEACVSFIAALSILSRKRDPVACLGWLFAVALFPIVGTTLYIIGGVSPYEALARRRRVSSRLVQSEDSPEERAYARAAALEALTTSDCNGFENTTAWAGWAAGHGFFPHTPVEFLENSTAVYAAFEEAIRNANRYVLVQFYQIIPDAVGRHFYGILAAKAQQGVAVHVLYDAMGSYRISKEQLKAARNAGIQIHSFMGFHPLKRRLQINWRNHRKLLVADGEVAFVGGLNLGEMYLEGHDPDNPTWRDVHFRLSGKIAAYLERTFREDWHFATGEALDLPKPSHNASTWDNSGSVEGVGVKSHGIQSQAGHELKFQLARSTGAAEETFHTLCLPVPSGPADSRTAFHTALLGVFYEARRRIWFSTAYFVPDKTILQALRQAVARGVDVKLVIPARSNHPITDFCTTSYYHELLEIGLTIHHFQPGMLHAKVLLADDDLILTGSSNQDYRSFFLNFELDLFIRDRPLAARIDRYFHDLIGKSDILTLGSLDQQYRNWTLLRRIARLFSPLM